ncbi:MAG: hypothetical protein KDD94_15285, partial [Calditrichaeota bacterium]|nr:hypothetical protein [Calditrichota bacterium]
MKYLAILIVITLSLAQHHHRHSGTCYVNNEDRYHSKHWKYIDLEDDYLSFDSYGDHVRITSDFELYVNNKKITVSSKEQRLLKRYVRLHEAIIENGINVGLAGAAIGVEGAKIGISSAAMAIKMVFNGDDDELDERIEKMTKRLERKAERIEERAESIEEDVEELVDLSCELKQRIRELRDIRWF